MTDPLKLFIIPWAVIKAYVPQDELRAKLIESQAECPVVMVPRAFVERLLTEAKAYGGQITISQNDIIGMERALKGEYP